MPTATRPAMMARPILAGVTLEVDTTQWQVRRKKAKRVVELSALRRREFYRSLGTGREAIGTLREFVLDWEHLAAMRDTLERILAQPGPHSLILWRFEYLSFGGDGVTTAFVLPFSQALDAAPTPPDNVSAAHFATVIRVGTAGTPLTTLTKNSVDYAAGTPASGNAWVLEGSTAFKVNPAPADDEYLLVEMVPVYSVLEAEETESRYGDPTREPRSLRLLEVGA